MEQINELLCKDCKHSFRLWSDFPHWGSGYEWRCRNRFVEAQIKIDPVIGPKKEEAYYEKCGTARMSRLTRDIKDEHCGPEAKHWSPKHKKHLFLAIKYGR